MKRAVVSSTNGGKQAAGRTNDVCWLPHDSDEVIWNLASKIAAAVGLPLEYAEPLQVVHYEHQEEYRKHWDAYDGHTERGNRTIASMGNRLVTALGYANSPKEGGGTGLPNLDLVVGAKAGRLLIFHDCYPGTSTKHSGALHAGLPVTAGEKWAFNLWFHDRPHQESVRAGERWRAKMVAMRATKQEL